MEGSWFVMFVAGLKRTNKGNSRDNYLFLLIINLMNFFLYLFIHFASLHVSSCLVCRPESCIPSSHLHRLIIQDDVLIQFDFLMMST